MPYRAPGPDRTIIHVRAGRVGASAAWLAGRPPAGELVLDLADVPAVRTGELGALAALNRAVRAAGGALRLVNVAAPVAGALAANRLDAVLDIRPPGASAA